MGCWFSVAPAMLTSERGRAAVFAMPKERVLPESDGPFGLVQGRPANPWDAWAVTSMLGELWREEESEIATRFVSNFKTVVDAR